MSRKRIMLTAAVAAVALAGLVFGMASDRAPAAQSATGATLACPHGASTADCTAGHDGATAGLAAAHDCGACRPSDAAAMGCPYAGHAAGEGSCPYADRAERGHCTRSTEPAFQRTESATPAAQHHVLVAAR